MRRCLSWVITVRTSTWMVTTMAFMMIMAIWWSLCTNSWVITAVVSNSQTDLMHHTHDNDNDEQRFPWKVWVTQLNGLVLLLHFCQDVFSHRVRGCVSVTASYCVCVSPDIDKPASMTQIIALLLTACSHFWRSCIGDNYMFDWVTVWLSDWVLGLIFTPQKKLLSQIHHFMCEWVIITQKQSDISWLVLRGHSPNFCQELNTTIPANMLSLCLN